MNTQNFLARLGLCGLLIAGITLAAASAALARHQWEDFHLQMPSNATSGDPTGPAEVTVHFYNVDNTTLFASDSDFRSALAGSLGEWSTEIEIGVAADLLTGDVALTADTVGNSLLADGACCSGSTFINGFYVRMNSTDSDLTPGSPSAVNSFNASYVNSGWLGIAIVEDSVSQGIDTDQHIIYGETYLNDFYATTIPIFTSQSDIRYVFCQELGHTLGLIHAKKDTGTCMYTARGLDSIGSTPSPNTHDGEMANDIAHGASAHGGGGGGGGGGGKPGGGGGGKPGGGGGPGGRPASAGPIVGDPWTAGNPTITAFWAERFESWDQLFDSADLVVSATVLAGSAFDRNVGPSGLPLPVSHAMLQVNATYKGQSTPVITLEQSRGPGFEIEDDPGYVRDDDYILYLRLIGTNTYRIVNPDGRVRQ